MGFYEKVKISKQRRAQALDQLQRDEKRAKTEYLRKQQREQDMRFIKRMQMLERWKEKLSETDY